MDMTTKEQVKVLWKQCFEDSDSFVDLYFKKRYSDDVNAVIERDGGMVSALQMIPYAMIFCGKIIPLSYVSGACTHPVYRRQGVMGKLLSEVHRKMFLKGDWLSVLIPANEGLFDYYAKWGYESIFNYSLQIKNADDLQTSPLYTIVDETDEQDFFAEHYRYFSNRIKSRSCCVLHSREDLEVVLEDLRLGDGRLLIARRCGLIHGMAFCIKDKNRVLIQEMFADNNVVKDSLMKEASQIFQMDKVACMQLPLINPQGLGMARVLQVEKMLSLFASKYPSVEWSLRVEGDEAIPENNDFYTVSNGKCVRGYLRNQVYHPCTINQLTRLLFAKETPYMSLMIN